MDWGDKFGSNNKEDKPLGILTKKKKRKEKEDRSHLYQERKETTIRTYKTVIRKH